MKGALTELADELGIPAGSRLEAELHALLLYGPGQFFVPHQDTEKNDAMIGTLTVTLPSSHTGGEFIIEHGSSEPPKRLVYLLDHKYTERGLRWDKLKCADAERATLLRAAADKADCEAVLALVMWTRERSFAAQAEASGLWALDELRRLADAGTWRQREPRHHRWSRSGRLPCRRSRWLSSGP